MADDTSASIITLHQPRPKKTTKTPAERAREYRQRKKAEKSVTVPDLPVPASVPATVSTPVTPLPPPTVALRAITPSRRSAAPLLLTVAALALAVVGMTMNGWFARSLGSTDTAGWLFLVIGVAADLVALVMPSCAAGLWQAGQRTTALAAWARECKGGVGKFCRERETAVTERRQAVDVAMRAVEQTADPQTEAAIRIVAWTSLGTLRPTADDFAMLRLVLLALLPQIGGILLMVGRVHRC